MSGATYDARRAWQWIAGGFALFLKAPLMWIALTLVMALLWIVSFLIPMLGPLLFNLLSPVLFAGLMLGCRALERGEELQLGHLFAGFQGHAVALVTVGGVYLVGSMIILSVVWAIAGGPVLQTLLQKGAAAMHAIPGASRSMGLALLTGSVLYLPLLMLIWFAPILVVFQGLKPVAAMKRSLAACLVNWLAFLIYGAMVLVLWFIATIPLLLGLLVLMPVLFCSNYASYKDIFVIADGDPPPHDIPAG
jgi:uncharacterized membrane protein